MTAKSSAADRRLARGIRNCNLGNVRRSKDKWQGAAPAARQTDRSFVVFENNVWGLRAVARILIRYQDHYGLRTIAKLITRYAPPEENDTAAYIAFVAKRTGFAADEKLDMQSYAHLRAIVEAIVVKEVGPKHGATPAEFDQALALAGVLPPPKPIAQTSVGRGAQVGGIGTAGVAVAIEYADKARELGDAVAPWIDKVQQYGPWLVAAVALIGVGIVVWGKLDERRRGLA